MAACSSRAAARYVQLEGRDRPAQRGRSRSPSLEAAVACYNSPAYQAALEHRARRLGARSGDRRRRRAGLIGARNNNPTGEMKMAQERVRWGVLSAGKIAREWVAPALHASERGDLVAVASRTPGKAEALAAPYGARTYSTYEALLADPDVDAIYIPLPNGDHVEWTAKCLEAGKHVLCEKPLALKAEEIDRLIALRDRTGLLAAEAFMVTHHPQWLRVRELIAEGAIGRLRQVQGAFTFFNDDPDERAQHARARRRRAARHRGVPERGDALRDRAGAGVGRRPRSTGTWASTPRRGCRRSSPTSTWTSTCRCGWRRGS